MWSSVFTCDRCAREMREPEKSETFNVSIQNTGPYKIECEVCRDCYDEIVEVVDYHWGGFSRQRVQELEKEVAEGDA